MNKAPKTIGWPVVRRIKAYVILLVLFCLNRFQSLKVCLNMALPPSKQPPVAPREDNDHEALRLRAGYFAVLRLHEPHSMKRALMLMSEATGISKLKGGRSEAGVPMT